MRLLLLVGSLLMVSAIMALVASLLIIAEVFNPTLWVRGIHLRSTLLYLQLQIIFLHKCISHEIDPFQWYSCHVGLGRRKSVVCTSYERCGPDGTCKQVSEGFLLPLMKLATEVGKMEMQSIADTKMAQADINTPPGEFDLVYLKANVKMQRPS